MFCYIIEILQKFLLSNLLSSGPMLCLIDGGPLSVWLKQNIYLVCMVAERWLSEGTPRAALSPFPRQLPWRRTSRRPAPDPGNRPDSAILRAGRARLMYSANRSPCPSRTCSGSSA